MKRPPASTYEDKLEWMKRHCDLYKVYTNKEYRRRVAICIRLDGLFSNNTLLMDIEHGLQRKAKGLLKL